MRVAHFTSLLTAHRISGFPRFHGCSLPTVSLLVAWDQWPRALMQKAAITSRSHRFVSLNTTTLIGKGILCLFNLLHNVRARRTLDRRSLGLYHYPNLAPAWIVILVDSSKGLAISSVSPGASGTSQGSRGGFRVVAEMARRLPPEAR